MQDKTKRAGAAGPLRPAEPRPGSLRRTSDVVLRWRETSILLACIVLAAYFQFSNPAFLSLSNIKNLIDFTATTAIIGAGEVMVLVCGEVDLFDFAAAIGQVGQVTRVGVHREHPAARRCFAAQPPREGPAAGSSLQAPPSRTHSQPLRKRDTRRVVGRAEQGKPLVGKFPIVGKCVMRIRWESRPRPDHGAMLPCAAAIGSDRIGHPAGRHKSAG